VSIEPTDGDYRFQSWFFDNWSRAGLACAVVLLALLPVVMNEGNRALILLATLLPVYMLHEYEEHGQTPDRFLAFVNATVGDGYEVLTKRAAFWINIGGVWALFLVSFYLARFVAFDFAFVPIYLTLVDAVVHLLTSLRYRGYNPGLWTSLVLFLPWGGYLLAFFNDLTRAGLLVNVAALLFAVVVHAAIVVFALRRRERLEAEGASAQSRLASGR
jgi:hypothetical protein